MSAWRYVYASVAGTSHAQTGLACQDFGLVAMIPGPEPTKILLVASDGAGTAMESAAGANVAVSTIASRLISHLGSASIDTVSKDVFQLWLDEVVHTLEARAYSLGTTLREHACTLLGAVVDQRGALFFQIGDGAVVVGQGAQYQPVFWPQNGEYANTTYFVTDEQGRAGLAFEHTTREITDVAVFTDGLQSLALRYATKDAHAPFFAGLFPHLRSEPPGEAMELKTRLTEWLACESINRRTDDDKTLLLATRPSGVDPG